MPRLTAVDKEIIRALIEADAMRHPDDAERFEAIFQAALRRSGLTHARRLEDIALWVNLRRERRAAGM